MRKGLGTREITLPPEVTTLWIKRLLDAGFLELPYDPEPHLADAQFYELQLASMSRSNTIKFALQHIPFPSDVGDVIRELNQRINPYQRWACTPNRSPRCEMPVDEK